jgi:carbon monoxide dehydrogenase subunit G
MRLENSFEVPAPPEKAWELLMDMPRVIPCMPGAKLDETVDDSNWKATVAVKLGPISLSFLTDVKREEADEAARRTKLSAKAREQRGRGAAQATIESSLAAMNGGTRVDLVTDLSLSGAVAQYGRGIVADVSSQLVQRFAECLQAQLTDVPAQAQAVTEPQSEPVKGLSLGLGALWRSIRRFFGRLFGRS